MRAVALMGLFVALLAVMAGAQTVTPPQTVRVELPASVDLRAGPPMSQEGVVLLAVRVPLAPTYIYRADVRWQALFFTSTGPMNPSACDGALLRLWVDDGLGYKYVGQNDGFQTVPPDRWTALADRGTFPVFYAGGSSVTFTLRMLGGACSRFMLGHEAVPRTPVGQANPAGPIRQRTFIEAAVTPLPR